MIINNFTNELVKKIKIKIKNKKDTGSNYKTHQKIKEMFFSFKRAK